MFCTECGKELPDGVRFCPVCGNSIANVQGTDTATPVAQEATPSTGEAAAAATTSPEPAPKKFKVAQIVVASVVAVVAVLGIGVFAYLQFFSGTPIDEEYFPDEKFRSFVASNIDTNGNGRLTAQEIEQATVVDLTGQTGIADVTGVAVFTNMESFNLGANKVENVDLSQNSQLKEINTQAATTESVHVPLGFTENGGNLLTGNTNVYEGPDTTAVLSEKSAPGGLLSLAQEHKGVLYVGGSLSALASGNAGNTPTDTALFFKNTDLFLYAENKVFWLETTQATSFYSTVIYMADEDGTNQKQVAQYAHMVVPIAYTNGWLFYSASSGPTATNVETGETKALKSFTGGVDPVLDGIAGTHNGNVVLKKATQNSAPSEYLLVSPGTWEVVGTLQAPNVAETQASKVTDQGVLSQSADGSMSMVDYEGNVLWSKTFDFAKESSDIIPRPYCSNKEAFFFPAKQGPAIQIINLETGDLSTIELENLEKAKYSSVDYANDKYVYIQGENSHLIIDRSNGQIVK